MSEDNTQSNKAQDGWYDLGHAHLPSPTAAPFFLCCGMSWMLWGLLTNFIVGWVGALVFVLALIKWMKDLFNEQH